MEYDDYEDEYDDDHNEEDHDHLGPDGFFCNSLCMS